MGSILIGRFRSFPPLAMISLRYFLYYEVLRSADCSEASTSLRHLYLHKTRAISKRLERGRLMLHYKRSTQDPAMRTVQPSFTPRWTTQLSPQHTQLSFPFKNILQSTQLTRILAARSYPTSLNTSNIFNVAHLVLEA